MSIAILFGVTTALAICCLWIGSKLSCGSAKVVDLLFIAALFSGLQLLPRPGWAFFSLQLLPRAGWALGVIFLYLLLTRVENIDSWPDAVVIVAVTSVVAPLAGRMLVG